MTKGCGCKICNADLGQYSNDLIREGHSPKSVLKRLKEQGLAVTKKVLLKHLDAFEIDYIDESLTTGTTDFSPVEVDLNDVDFEEFSFDYNQPDSIIAYLQKVNLQIYLNQLKVVMQSQEDKIRGVGGSVSMKEFRNLAVAFQILEKSTALSLQVEQRKAIRVVESLGLKVEPLIQIPPNVDSLTDSEAD